MVKAARYLTVLGIGLSASAFVGWLLLRENRRNRVSAPLSGRALHTGEGEESASEIVLPREVFEETVDTSSLEIDHESDDLTAINDIGPRFASALAEVGITRFEQLAIETPETLAARLAPYISVRASRIGDKNWIGQAQAKVARRVP